MKLDERTDVLSRCKDMHKTIFFSLLLILSIVCAPVTFAGTDDTYLDENNIIFLKSAEIDTRNTYSTVETGSTVVSSSTSSLVNSEENHYIVQFTGRVLPEWKDEIRLSGATIYDYIPNNAYVIRMNNSNKDHIQTLEFVQWIGEYKAEYKLSPEMTETEIQISAASESTTSKFSIVLFDKKDNSKAIKEISSIGGEVVQESGIYMIIQIDENRISDLSKISNICWIEKYSEPVLSNDVATTIMNVNPVHSNHGLNGSGQIVAVADTGLDTGVDDNSMHDDIEGRIINITDYSGDGAADYNGHGTHVAGSILGNGAMSGGHYKGVAPEASLVFQSLEAGGSLYLPTDLATLFQSAYDEGARIHSNSWSYQSELGNYTYRSRQVDQFTWDHPDMLILFSAGNCGSDKDGNGVVDHNSITPPATSKNSIAVGASENDRGDGFGTAYTIWGGTNWWGGLFTADPIKNDYTANNFEGIAAFSSRGPTDDERIKPDLVAPGTFIASTRSSQPSWYEWGGIDNYYAYSSGTSMSTPLVAGSAALVREYYTDIEQLEKPSASLLKATLINGAHDATPGQYGTGSAQEIQKRPDYSQGWGLVDVENSLFPEYPKVMTYDDKNSLDMSELWTVNYGIFKESEPVRLTLTWTDFPGAVFASTTLVNDLNLKVTGPDDTYYGNGGIIADDKNNVEGIEIISPVAGNYAINVDGYDVQHGPQNFSLVLSFTCENNNFPENTPTVGSDTVISTDVVHPADVNVSSIIMKVDGTPVTFSSTDIPYGHHIEYEQTSSYGTGKHDVAVTASTLNGRQFEYEWEFTVEASKEKEITAFEFNEPAVTATINETARTITATVPYGTDITALTPTIDHTGESISPGLGVAQDFSSTVIYTVTAEDASTKSYDVTINEAQNTEKQITSFKFASPAVTGKINETAGTISATVAYGTDVTALIPIISHNGNKIAPESGVAQNFTNPVIYTVTAQDSSIKDYTVTVRIAKNTEKEITSFEFTNPAVAATINETTRNITVTVPYGTDVTALIPTIDHTGNEIAPESGKVQNFTNPITYTVTAEDSSTKTYTVTVNVSPNSAKEITSFSFEELDPIVNGNIDESTTKISLTVPFGTNITALVPTIDHTGNSISPNTGLEQNFTNPIIYTVTAVDSTTQDYTVTVTIASKTTTQPASTTSSGGGGGGGGGGGSTGEEYENIAFKDVSSAFISTGTAGFEFSDDRNDIKYIRYESLKNAGKISTTIEVLKGTSALVSSAPDDLVYRNINIWVGKTGYAIENNIADPVIGFKISKKWIDENAIDVESISLNRYSNGKWEKLSTSNAGDDGDYLLFEAKTPGFSPFAITGEVQMTENRLNAAEETRFSTDAELESNATAAVITEPDNTLNGLPIFISCLILTFACFLKRKQ